MAIEGELNDEHADDSGSFILIAWMLLTRSSGFMFMGREVAVEALSTPQSLSLDLGAAAFSDATAWQQHIGCALLPSDRV